MPTEKKQPQISSDKKTRPKTKPYKVTYSETFVDTAPLGEWQNHPKD